MNVLVGGIETHIYSFDSINKAALKAMFGAVVGSTLGLVVGTVASLINYFWSSAQAVFDTFRTGARYALTISVPRAFKNALNCSRISPALGSITQSAPAAVAAARRIGTASIPMTGWQPAARAQRKANCPMIPNPSTANERPSVSPARTDAPSP